MVPVAEVWPLLAVPPTLRMTTAEAGDVGIASNREAGQCDAQRMHRTASATQPRVHESATQMPQ